MWLHLWIFCRRLLINGPPQLLELHRTHAHCSVCRSLKHWSQRSSTGQIRILLELAFSVARWMSSQDWRSMCRSQRLRVLRPSPPERRHCWLVCTMHAPPLPCAFQTIFEHVCVCKSSL